MFYQEKTVENLKKIDEERKESMKRNKAVFFPSQDMLYMCEHIHAHAN